ncbi:hypothetical protein ACI2JA_03465 [Alkalihalobacillus sp. NPDC078783]
MTIYNVFSREIYDFDASIQEHQDVFKGKHNVSNDLAVEVLIEAVERILLFVDVREDNLKQHESLKVNLLSMIYALENHQKRVAQDYALLDKEFFEAYERFANTVEKEKNGK